VVIDTFPGEKGPHLLPEDMILERTNTYCNKKIWGRISQKLSRRGAVWDQWHLKAWPWACPHGSG